MARGQANRRLNSAEALIRLAPAELAQLPACPGIYAFRNAAGQLLYVGKSVNLRARVRSYFRSDGGHTHRTARLKHEATLIEALPLGSELEALLVESRWIKDHLPPYNVRGRRYEHYPFLRLTEEPVPRLELTRLLEDDGSRYYGPFASSAMVRDVVDTLNLLFGLRSCATLPPGPCLALDLGRCLGPCRGEVPEYGAAVEAVEKVLQGEAEQLLAALWQDMQAASEREDYERAARVRDRHELLQRLVATQARLRDASVGLDLLVVLPGFPPTDITVLAIRRARWVGQWSCNASRLGHVASRRSLVRFMRERFVEAAAPGVRIDARELDEVQIVGSWLYRRRLHPGIVAIDAEDLEACALQVIAAGRPDNKKAGP